MLLKEDTASKVQFKKSVFCHNCQSVGANFDQNWIVHFTKIELQHVVIFKKNVYVFCHKFQTVEKNWYKYL